MLLGAWQIDEIPNEVGEEWRPVVGYDEDYWVSSHGRLISCKRGKPHLMRQANVQGYRSLDLCKDGVITTYRVHRIIAQAFLPDYSEDLTVNHKNMNRANNHISNLEMMTVGDNLRHGHANNHTREYLNQFSSPEAQQALEDEHRMVIEACRKMSGCSKRAVARALNVSHTHINRICKLYGITFGKPHNKQAAEDFGNNAVKQNPPMEQAEFGF